MFMMHDNQQYHKQPGVELAFLAISNSHQQYSKQNAGFYAELTRVVLVAASS
jgi:hypothetical protein